MSVRARHRGAGIEVGPEADPSSRLYAEDAEWH